MTFSEDKFDWNHNGKMDLFDQYMDMELSSNDSDYLTDRYDISSKFDIKKNKFHAKDLYDTSDFDDDLFDMDDIDEDDFLFDD